jgi:hypothetical protein
MAATLYRCSGPGLPASWAPQPGTEGGDWAALPPELVAKIYAELPLRDRKLGAPGPPLCLELCACAGLCFGDSPAHRSSS